jgi:hypothetical protein
MFTERRLMFYSTLTTLSLLGAVVKLGAGYLNTAQSTRTALQSMIPPAELEKTMTRLFGLAAFSPFNFQQVSQAFRSIFVGFHAIGISAQETERTLKNMMDALAQGGFLTERNVRQVSNALQDLGFQGVLTQRMVTRLGQIGVPIRPALIHQLHLAADQMQNVGKMGIPAAVAIEAVNREIERTSFHDAARRQALNTLYGNLQVLRDFIGMAAGRTVGGGFSFLFKSLQRVNLELAKMSQAGKMVGFTDIVRIFDREWSPSTHAIINLFILLEYTLKGFIGTVFIVAKAVQVLIWPFAKLFGFVDRTHATMKALGITLGAIIGIWTLYRTTLIAVAIVEAILTIIQIAHGKVMKANTLILGTSSSKGLRGGVKGLIEAWKRWAFEWKLVQGSMTAYERAHTGALARLSRAFWRLVPAITTAAIQAWNFTAALLANPITWIVVAVLALTVGLVLLVTQVKAVNHWLRENYWWFSLIIMLVMGPLGLYVNAVIIISLYWKRIAGWIEAAYNWMKKLVGLKWAPGAGGGGFFSRLLNVAKFTPLNPLLGPTLAYEGIKRRQVGGWASGLTMVGERGPEMVRLPASSRVFPAGQMPAMAGAGIRITVVPQPIYFDRQKIGEVMASVVTDREARL